MKTLVLAHYYTTPEVQQMATFVGDSLDLSMRAKESDAERIVFAGVKFMAETAKIINPNAQVILPDETATCSLVTQSEDNDLEVAIKILRNTHTIVSYINTSYKIKAISDVIVTSANVQEIISDIIESGKNVFFTPDRNMGAYLKYNNPQWGDLFYYYKEAVCEVHDKFKSDEIYAVMAGWSNYGKILLAHPESPLPVLKKADLVGSTRKMLEYVKNVKGFPEIYVATEEGLLYNMREARPDLDIQLAPIYTGCQCNSCPFMKMNTRKSVQGAIDGTSGFEIDYISEVYRMKAKQSVDNMLNWGTK